MHWRELRNKINYGIIGNKDIFQKPVSEYFSGEPFNQTGSQLLVKLRAKSDFKSNTETKKDISPRLPGYFSSVVTYFIPVLLNRTTKNLQHWNLQLRNTPHDLGYYASWQQQKTVRHVTLVCIQDTLSSRARLAECVAREQRYLAYKTLVTVKNSFG